jgi:multisubunit Na+/H+ antiporter MnhF subunit
MDTLYVALAVGLVAVSAVIALLVGRLLEHESAARQLIGASICLAGVVCTFVVLALKGNYNSLILAIGTFSFVASVLAILNYFRRATGPNGHV